MPDCHRRRNRICKGLHHQRLGHGCSSWTIIAEIAISKPGTNMPPLHLHCRSTIAGSIDSTPKS